MDIEPAISVVKASNVVTWSSLADPEWLTCPGRPRVFSQGFLKDLAGVWASHGKETMI